MGLGRAAYKCCVCGHRWESAPSSQTECRKCGSLYCIWLNFDKWQISEEHAPAYMKIYRL